MEVKNKVKQRRQQRLRSLQETTEANYGREHRMQPSRTGGPQRPNPEPPPYPDPEWKRRMEDPEYAWRHKFKMDPALSGRDYAEEDSGLFAPPSSRSIAVKLIVSGIIFAAIWGMFQLQQPWAAQGRQFVTASLTESYDFAALSAWYEERLGGYPSFIPSFRGSAQEEAVKVNASKRTLFAPARGSIVAPYDGTTRLGVTLRTQDAAPVYALDTGQIIFAGVKEDTGLTIIIRHPGGLQSLYGSIGEAHVEVNDWVKGGEAVGKTSKADPSKGTLYFALTKDGHPVNPADVISFD